MEIEMTMRAPSGQNGPLEVSREGEVEEFCIANPFD
jgi:hypothetical protein